MSSEIEETLNQKLKHTPLYEEHKKLNAKMIPFCGWEMPVQYPTGLLAEHKAVRSHVGLFDVSHMGEIEICGQQSEQFLQKLTINNIAHLQCGQAQYNAICNEHGGLLDDVIIYKKKHDLFLICVNASNIEKDFNWLLNHNTNSTVSILNKSEEYGQIAVQGSKSRDIMRAGFSETDAHRFQNLPYYHFFEAELFGIFCLIARTGYTGELGYEIYCPANSTAQIWNALFNYKHPDYSVVPCGLGARDILRLEVGYLLYGNDMDEQINPLECGLKWITKLEKTDFIGKEAILQASHDGIKKNLVGFEMLDRAIGRHGYTVFDSNNPAHAIGVVTSGSPSPSLGKNIGLMSVSSAHSKMGNTVLIDIRGSLKPAKIVSKQFYKNNTNI